MRFWFDTEFIEDGKTIDLLSIGIAAEDGSTFYAENTDADLSRGSDWVQRNVIVHLNWNDHGVTRKQLRDDVLEFVSSRTSEPEFWAYYSAYDWVALCQLFGTMMDLPKGWPMYCRDVKQLCDQMGNPTLPKQSNVEHHALADAIWTKRAWIFLLTNK